MSSSMNNINYSEFKNICRTCMLSCNIKYSQDHVISDVFYKLTDIHFETNDELPQQICPKCFEKINEIHQFAFQCKQTHYSLLQCLNNFKSPRIKEEPDIEELHEPYKTEEETDEHVIDFLKVEVSNSTSEYVIDELKFKEEIVEDKNNELNKNTNPVTSDDQNTFNINLENEQELNDFNPLESDDSLDIDSAENNKGISKNTNDKQYKCDDSIKCSKSFSQNCLPKNHIYSQSDKILYNCDKCSKSFSTSFNLKTHLRTHSGERPYKCEQCSKSFVQLVTLKDHMRTHSGERPYKCKVCSKSFSLTSNLNKHMRIHSDIRLYECEQCSKSFTLSADLKRHMRTHSGERPFKCNQCSKLFSRSDILTRHMRTHTGKCMYICSYCNRNFVDLSALTTHKRTHTGERPYQCSMCDSSFARNDNLKKHLLVHSDEGSSEFTFIAIKNESHDGTQESAI